MTTRAESSFAIDGWEEEEVHDADGVRIYRVKVTKVITGELEGTAQGWMTMAMAPGDSAAYVGFDRLDVTVDGRRGSFVIRHNALMYAGGGDAAWDIVPGSGTGELTGIRGTSTVHRDDDGNHTYAIDYDLNDLGTPPAEMPSSVFRGGWSMRALGAAITATACVVAMCE